METTRIIADSIVVWTSFSEFHETSNQFGTHSIFNYQALEQNFQLGPDPTCRASRSFCEKSICIKVNEIPLCSDLSNFEFHYKKKRWAIEILKRAVSIFYLFVVKS